MKTTKLYQRLYSNMNAFCPSYKYGNAVYTLCEVINPTLVMLLPSFLLMVYQNNHSVDTKMLWVGGYILLCGIVLAIRHFIFNRIRVNRFMFRSHEAIKCMIGIMDMDFAYYESDEHKKRYEAVMAKAVYQNEFGLEGVLRETNTIVIGVMGFILYCILLKDMGILMITIIVGIGILQTVMYYLFQTKVIAYQEKKALIDKDKKYLNKVSTDIHQGKDIRIYEIETWFDELYDDVNQRLYDVNKKEVGMTFTSQIGSVILLAIQSVVIYSVLFRMMQVQLSANEFLLIVSATSAISLWVTMIMKSISHLRIDIKGSKGFYTYYDDIRNEGNQERQELNVKGDIQFVDVCFKYPTKDEYTLYNFNLHLKAGEHVALVGPNGAGKSTLIKLMCGLYTPVSGQILVDGVDVATLPKKQVYEIFGTVFQEVSMNQYELKDNISCSLDGDDERVINCLKRANVYDVVEKTKNGIYTSMGKMFDSEGQSFSGGQLQKFTLARALYKDAPILLLDEPTAALDPLAEKEMYESYSDLSGGKTSLFISHRLASTQFCDRIIYFEKGEVLEDGTHIQLMKDNKGYRNMFDVQAKYYKEGNAHEEDY